MAEGPLVHLNARQLRKVLKGRKVNIEFGVRKMKKHEKSLRAVRIEDVEAYGKQFRIRLDDTRIILVHLAMWGYWRIYRKGQPWERPKARARLVLRTSSHEAIAFSAPTVRLLASLSDFDPGLADIRENLIVKNNWSHEEFGRVNGRLRNYGYAIDIERVNLGHLRDFVKSRRDFLVRLLENPSLLEHESFTELLRAVFHLTEELQSRDDMSCLPESDRQHLAGDIKRVYVLIVRGWLDYMEYLRDSYPYLFSLAMRTNPFDRDASPIVG